MFFFICAIKRIFIIDIIVIIKVILLIRIIKLIKHIFNTFFIILFVRLNLLWTRFTSKFTLLCFLSLPRLHYPLCSDFRPPFIGLLGSTVVLRALNSIHTSIFLQRSCVQWKCLVDPVFRNFFSSI